MSQSPLKLLAIRESIRRTNPVKKMMARQEKAQRLSKLEETRMFKGKAFNEQREQQQYNQQFKQQQLQFKQVFIRKLLLTILASNFINKKSSILGKASMSRKNSV